MSATLVGSEMCIRDRATSAGRGRSSSRQPRPTMSPVVAFHRMTQIAVSYTHLTLPTICSV
eukprot:5037802-Alexandrium_andersonii.AAC.1